VEANDPSAPQKALAEADAFLSSFGDPSGTSARRADLLAELHERLPKNARAVNAIKIISRAAVGA